MKKRGRETMQDKLFEDEREKLFENEQDKPQEVAYDVTLNTPIGKRDGTAVLKQDGGEVTGVLKMLGAEKEFKGSIDENGGCQVSGKLKTLGREISYRASGVITGEMLDLTLRAGNFGYVLTGKRKDER